MLLCLKKVEKCKNLSEEDHGIPFRYSGILCIFAVGFILEKV